MKKKKTMEDGSNKAPTDCNSPVQKEEGRRTINPRTFDKTSRNLTTLYLPKILHSTCKCVQT